MSVSNVPELDLVYFDLPGRGEFARLVMLYSKLPFTDTRIQFEDFPKLKPSLPFGQLPILKINESTTLATSVPIARYVAKLGGLYPTDPLKALEADMYVDVLMDIFQPVGDIMFYEKDEQAKVRKTTELLENKLPKSLGIIEERIEKNYLVGQDITYADICLFDLIHNSLSNFDKFSIEKYPRVKAIVKRVESNPDISKYLQDQAAKNA